jgi:hypothetical protein
MMRSRKLSPFSSVLVQQVLLYIQCLNVPVWASMGPTWHKFCDIPTLFPLCSKFPGYNLSIAQRSLSRKSLWADNCARSWGMWPVSHIIVATAEMYHSSIHRAHIHHLVPVNIQQLLIRNSMKHLCFVCTFMPACSSAAIAWQQTYNTTGRKVQPLLPYHQNLPLRSLNINK